MTFHNDALDILAKVFLPCGVQHDMIVIFVISSDPFPLGTHRDRQAQGSLSVKQKKPEWAFLGPGAPMEITRTNTSTGRTPVLSRLHPSPGVPAPYRV